MCNECSTVAGKTIEYAIIMIIMGGLNNIVNSTSNIEIAKSCQEFFGFELPSTLLSKRIAKFESMYHNP